ITGSPLSYLREKACSIDVLMLFHVKTETIYAALLYKWLNPYGYVYVKYDLPDQELLYAAWGNRNFLTQAKRNILFKLFVQKLDLLSVECRQVYENLDKIPASQKMLLPNGFAPEIPAYYGVSPRSFEEKENIILLVGRHGTKQKNSELMFKVFEKLKGIGEWQVLFVGPMTNDFVLLKDKFLEDYPGYHGKLHFSGAVTDKKLLFEYYSRAKIFCLPSRWESWGLVCGEALYFGCTLVMTHEVSSSPDLTDNGLAGLTAANEDVDAWATLLQGLMQDQSRLKHFFDKGKTHFDNHFSWPRALYPLVQRMSLLKEDVTCNQ
ncbi:MAG: glycosyltransferase family 4 protein, partial [Geobacter sp.]|nr:glycosyltransferase family 4 protein [Geobacter sp.]